MHMAMKVKKAGTGKSHGAYPHIPCFVTSQESILSKGWKTTQTCWPLRSNTIFLILHQVPFPSSHLLTSSLSTAIVIPRLLKSADFLILLLMALSETQQHLRLCHYEQTPPSEEFPSWAVICMGRHGQQCLEKGPAIVELNQEVEQDD